MLVFCVPIFIIAILCGLLGFPKAIMWLALNVWSPFMLTIVGGRTELVNKEKLDKNKTYIYVANHASHFDIPAMFSAMRIPLFFIAKKELKKVPLFGYVCTLLGIIWLDRSNKMKAMESMRQAGVHIKKGKNVVTFPEGTRSKSGALGMFRKGTFSLALMGEIDVVPVAIIGTRPLNPPGKFKFTGSRVKVVIGDVIPHSDFQDRSPEEFADYAKEQVEKLTLENS